MMKLKVIIYEPYLDPVLLSLIDKGLIQFIDLREKFNSFKDVLTPIEATDILSKATALNSRITNLIKNLSIPESVVEDKVKPKRLAADEYIKIEEELTRIEEQYKEFTTKLSEIDAAAAELEKLRQEKDEVSSQIKKLSDMTDIIVAEKVKSVKLSADEFNKIQEELSRIETQYKELTTKLGKIDSAAPELEKLHKEKDEVLNQIKKLAEQKRKFLLTSSGSIKLEKTLEETKLQFGKTAETIYFEGWVPEGKTKETTKIIKEASESFCIVEPEKPEKEETVPTLLKNPKFLQSFQKLATSYGIPSYHEFDPTSFISFTFPIIFGLMFPDVGHGLILVAVSLLILFEKRKGVPQSEIIRYVFDAGELLLLCGITAIIGGLIFGGFFGVPLTQFGITPPLAFILTYIPRIGRSFDPFTSPMLMFRLALYVGTLHITSGLVLNLSSKLINREFKEAFFEPVCWLWFYLGLMYLVLFNYGVNIDKWTSNLFPTVILLVILPVIIMMGGKMLLEGLIGGFSASFEIIISSIGNTVSYGRILALALVHEMLSQVLIMADALGIIGLGVIAIGTIMLIMLLEGLIVFIHTVRLHWLEWFSKFYKGEGIEYKPFMVQK